MNSSGKKSIFDLLYELILWANYTGVQLLMKLSDGGYQKILVRNLATLVCFSGGMAELTAIAALGEKRYKGLLKKFSINYQSKHSYSLDQYGLTSDQVVVDFKPIFDRFGFESVD